MIYLHIGTHKTGSTSLQRFLSDNSKALRHHGYELYTGCMQNPMNHIELHLYALNDNRDTFAKYNFPSLELGTPFRTSVQELIHGFLRSSSEPHQIFTGESLSWLRFDAELIRLKNLVKCPPSTVKVILYLRNKKDFLNSYEKQIYKKRNRYASSNKESVLYIQDDTWLIDYDWLISIYEKHFDPENLVILDYDQEMQNYNNIIPSFLQVLNIPFKNFDYEQYFFNQS